MSQALILHGTGGYPTESWFDWLRQELDALGCGTTVPQLPGSDKPNLRRYNHFLLDELKYDFNEQTILIGHSSGAVAILGLLQALPDSVRVDTCYLVGSFKDDLGWEALRELFDPALDLAVIKNKAKHFVFIHADNDPYCPLQHAQYLSSALAGELIVKEGQKHFSVGTMGEAYRTFPFLLDLIKERNFS